uniref:NACHT, LRR and PYD domains-containing protein 12 n=1 Tax=Microcebus murinus TaxID=30608 RepID=A0A8C5Y871_MICMU
MPRPPVRDGLCLLSTYLEELEAVELKKFKLYLGTVTERGEDKIPWGRMETAGPLDMAQLLTGHFGTEAAWLLALGLFERINRRDLWEKGQREDLVRDTPPGGPSSLGSQSACLLEVSPGTPRKDPGEAYRDSVRRRFRLMQDRNARPGECVNLSRRYTRLLLVREHSHPTRARQKLLDTGRGRARAAAQQASPIRLETLFEPDAERPEPPRTVVLQGAAGIGKSMLARKVMLDWADGKLFRGRFDYVFYVNCRDMNQGAERSARDLVAGCWPEPRAPLHELLRVPERLLLIIDGFDELEPSFHDAQGPWCACWEEKRPAELLLSSLIGRKLLPELSLLITTRPAALEQLHGLLEQPRCVEILGFSEAERKEYFHKYFPDAQQASQAFHFVRDNEPLFTMCFVPMVCWVVCTCLRQQLEGGGLLRQACRTTTAVYLLYLLSLTPPAPATRSLRGLCSLACDGLWHQKVLFEERDLGRHGLRGAEVSAFLNMDIFQKDINCEKYYSFIHLSFQEFFAAMHYVLDGAERGSGPGGTVTRLLAEYGFAERSFLALTVRFLFGLLNEETRGYLEKSLSWKVSPGIKAELLGWIESKAQSEGSTLQRGSLELFSCLHEIQDEEFIQRALSPFRVVVVSDIASRMEHMVSSFCVKSCRNVQVLHLRGAAHRAHEDDRAGGTLGAQTPLAQSLKKCHISSSACQDLAATLIANKHLIRMDLSGNSLGLPGIELLCEGLQHPKCRLQMIRLKICHLTAAACEDLAPTLRENRSLVELDLGLNELGDPGTLLLCQGLRHPTCTLQTLRLGICRLGAVACAALCDVLQASRHLLELDLSFNDLGDGGLRLLGAGLRHPACRLQKLW